MSKIFKQQSSVLAFPPTDQGRHDRRLSMDIQLAFEHACDEGEVIAAAELLSLLELVRLREPPAPQQQEAAVEPLMAAHIRLWRTKAEAARRSFEQPADDTTVPRDAVAC